MTITHAGTLIASDSPFAKIEGLQVATTLKVQTRRMVRASAARHRAKGAKRSQITFSVRRSHASAAEASDFYLTHAQEISGPGAAAIICGEPGDTQELTLAAAQLTAQGVTRSGIQTIHRYTLTGGEIS